MSFLYFAGVFMSETPGGITVQDVVANTFTMGPKEVTSITDDPTTGSPEALVTGAALSTAVAGLINAIQQNVQNVLTGLDGEVVLTQNLVNPTFRLTTQDPLLGWTTVGWQNPGVTASISNPSGTFSTPNKFSVPPGRYPNTGVYFLMITTSAVSGNLAVVLNNTTIGTITSPGEYNFAFTVNNALTTTLDLVATGIAAGHSIILTNAVLTGINPVLYNLLQFITEQFTGSNQSAEIAAAVAAALAEAESFTTDAIVTYNTTLLGEANPLPQYVLASFLSDSAILPDVVVYSPDAYVPPGIPGYRKLRSSTILKTATLDHISQSTYSAQSGYFTSTGATTTPLVNAVKNSGTSPTEPTTEFVLIPGSYPSITYTFAKPRLLSEVVLFTGLQSGVACVTQATIAAGGITRTVNITPGAINTVVSGNGIFDNVLVSSFVITVLAVNDTTKSNFSLGFDVIFADTAGQDIAISSGTTVAFNYGGQVIGVTTTADIPINVSSIISGHDYTLTVKTTDGVAVVPEILSITPTLGDGSGIYKYPFDEFTSNSDPYYGTTAIVGVSSGANNYEIYTGFGAVVFNSNYVTVTQTLVAYNTIDHLNLRFPVTLPGGAGYPTSITVNVTQAGGTTTALTIPAVWNVDELSTDYSILVPLLSYGPLSSFQVILVSAGGTTVALDKIDVAVPCLAYDTTKHTWSDGAYRKTVGNFTLLANGEYLVSSRPVGTECVVAVNDLLPTAFYSEYTIVNPFKTKNIGIIPMDQSGNVTADVIVQNITDSSLIILATTVGVYLLNVTRFI